MSLRGSLAGLMGSAWCKAVFAGLVLLVSWLAFTPNPPPGADLGWDKANHASAFATLMLVAACAWPQWLRASPAALLAYGGLIEIVQSFIPGRDGEWPDLLADGVGIVLGLALFALLWHLLQTRRR